MENVFVRIRVNNFTSGAFQIYKNNQKAFETPLY